MSNSPCRVRRYAHTTRTKDVYGSTHCFTLTTDSDPRFMNVETQHPLLRERLYRRERRSVGVAREFARAVLADWGNGWPTDDVLLCVSELATNALLHGVLPGRGYRLRLWSYADGLLRVEVHDSGDGLPHIAVPADESGRGLLLVQALADAWGVDQRKPGKVVWCEWRP